MDNATRRHLLNRHRASGFPGSILDVYKAYNQGVDLIGQFEQQNNIEVARTPEQQQQGLRPAHQAGDINKSMVFPNVPPNTPFTTEGMKAPINIEKYDEQGHLVKSYENVPPGVRNLPTGPQRGTVIETPANMQGGGIQFPSLEIETDPEMLYIDKYNTELSAKEQKQFDRWVSKESEKQGRDIMMDKGAYDIQGFWKSGDWKDRDSDGHGSDKWKKPNHPTFSNQSKYHGVDGHYGGIWKDDGGFQPSKQTMGLYNKEYYDWMFGAEPHRPEYLDLSRYESGENAPSPLFYQKGGVRKYQNAGVTISPEEYEAKLDAAINKYGDVGLSFDPLSQEFAPGVQMLDPAEVTADFDLDNASMQARNNYFAFKNLGEQGLQDSMGMFNSINNARNQFAEDYLAPALDAGLFLATAGTSSGASALARGFGTATRVAPRAVGSAIKGINTGKSILSNTVGNLTTRALNPVASTRFGQTVGKGIDYVNKGAKYLMKPGQSVMNWAGNTRVGSAIGNFANTPLNALGGQTLGQASSAFSAGYGAYKAPKSFAKLAEGDIGGAASGISKLPVGNQIVSALKAPKTLYNLYSGAKGVGEIAQGDILQGTSDFSKVLPGTDLYRNTVTAGKLVADAITPPTLKPTITAHKFTKTKTDKLQAGSWRDSFVAESTAQPNYAEQAFLNLQNAIPEVKEDPLEEYRPTQTSLKEDTRTDSERKIASERVEKEKKREEAIEKGINPNLAFMMPQGLQGDPQAMAAYQYDNPLSSPIGSIATGIAGIPIDIGIGAGVGYLAPRVSSAASNIFQNIPRYVNPNYFKPSTSMYYRGISKEGMEDALSSGVFRAKPADMIPPSYASLGGKNFDMAKRFKRTYYSPKFGVADRYGAGYIAEVPADAAKFSRTYKGSDWSMSTADQIPIEQGRILQKNWWSGYKPMQYPENAMSNILLQRQVSSIPQLMRQAEIDNLNNANSILNIAKREDAGAISALKNQANDIIRQADDLYNPKMLKETTSTLDNDAISVTNLLARQAQNPLYRNKYGGIRIKEKNRGKFTAFAKSKGMSVQEAARHVLANKDRYSTTLIRRANFARNAARWNR